jgi:hypothetical protein
MRILKGAFALALMSALCAVTIAGCDDRDADQGKAAKQTVSILAKSGAGWRATAETRLSSWGFKPGDPAIAGLEPAMPDPLIGIRAALEANMLPPRDAIRIADLVGRSLPPQRQTAEADPEIFLTESPWNEDTLLLWVEVPGAVIAAGQPISIEFDPKTVVAFRPLGDPMALPRPDGPDGRVAMLYELSAPTDDRAHPDRRFAVLHLGPGLAAGSEPAAPKRDIPVTAGAYSANIEDAPAIVRFAAAIAGFAELLRGDPAVRDLSCGDMITLAESDDAPDPDGARAQLIGLMHRAEPLIDQPQPDSPGVDEK